MLSQIHQPSDGKQNAVEGSNAARAHSEIMVSNSDDHRPRASSTTRDSLEHTRISHSKSPALLSPSNGKNEPRDIILQSFAPRVSVYTSADTDELIRLKGIYGGLYGLLKPFGEVVQGRVVIRDSIGASKSWNDFGVQFMDLDKQRPSGSKPSQNLGNASYSQNILRGNHEDSGLRGSVAAEEAEPSLSLLDEIIHSMLQQAEQDTIVVEDDPSPPTKQDPLDMPIPPPYYSCFLRSILSGRPMVPHETFTHPVACLIAISSQNPNPIETLRDLYNETRQGSKHIPSWAEGEFLRYYVLVHDEDQDDITKSIGLFNQMKRHFGLHCHLLRLRSVQCSTDDKDGTKLPNCKWLSVEEKAAELHQSSHADSDELQQYLYETDATAIRMFVREMITQSVIPFMENRVTSWNDQVASRRRGISGRFVSLSKRWGAFGTTRSSKSSANLPGGSGTNYNSNTESYAWDTPEAVMHRLADYAFMLRDWRLASSIYDILRGDFCDDKAWRHHAIANEMMAVGILLNSEYVITKVKLDTINQSIDTATYSHLSRCRDSYGTLRCLVLALELYKSRSGSPIGEAAKWAERILDLAISSRLVQCLVISRLALCYSSIHGIGKMKWGSRKRKAAFWNFLSSVSWNSSSNPLNAGSCLKESGLYYGVIAENHELLPFGSMQDYWLQLQREISLSIRGKGVTPNADYLTKPEDAVDEEQKIFVAPSLITRKQRFSAGVMPLETTDLFQHLPDKEDYNNDGFI